MTNRFEPKYKGCNNMAEIIINSVNTGAMGVFDSEGEGEGGLPRRENDEEKISRDYEIMMLKRMQMFNLAIERIDQMFNTTDGVEGNRGN